MSRCSEFFFHADSMQQLTHTPSLLVFAIKHIDNYKCNIAVCFTSVKLKRKAIMMDVYKCVSGV